MRRLHLFAALTIVVSALACTSNDQHAAPAGSGGAGGGQGGVVGDGGGAGGSGSGGDAGVTSALHPLAITGSEAVTRVAKVLWQTSPDADLLGRAGALKTREDVNRLALDMLKDPRARAGVGAFYRWWLWLDIDEQHDTTRFPEWTAAVKADVAKAVELYAVNVTLDMNGSFRTLMTAPFTYANDRLARFYGFTGVTGADLQKVDVDPKQRGGLLAQPSLLARVHPLVSSPEATNPPMRGRILLNHFRCVDLSPVHMPVIPPHPELSNRQFFATVTAGVSGGVPCVLCHYGNELNAMGFTFEGYDAIGRLRTVDDRGKPVDVGGLRIQNGSGAEATYQTPAELGAVLADNPEVQACLGRQWSGYARGLKAAADADQTDPDIQLAFKAADLNLRALIAAVVSSAAFLAPVGANADGGAGGTGGLNGHDAGAGQTDADTTPANCSVPAIFNKHSCTGLCHAPAYAPAVGGGLDLVSPGWEKTLLGVGPTTAAPETNACKGKGLNYLNKTQPATGLLLDKLKPNVPCGMAMPPLGDPLTAGELACVQKWADDLVAASP